VDGDARRQHDVHLIGPVEQGNVIRKNFRIAWSSRPSDADFTHKPVVSASTYRCGRAARA
jgi:hypothetical protein